MSSVKKLNDVCDSAEKIERMFRCIEHYIDDLPPEKTHALKTMLTTTGGKLTELKVNLRETSDYLAPLIGAKKRGDMYVERNS